MKTTFLYSCYFSWFVDKALSNIRKHGIAFEDAMEAFVDPLAAIRPDSGHCLGEERWLALGMLRDGALGVVVHVYEEMNDHAHVRIISARKATHYERQEYETGVYSVREPSLMGEYNMNTHDDDDMCAEYDFSNAIRGKYFRPNMVVVSFPIYLDDDVLAHFRSLARARGIETREILNQVLRRHLGSPADSPGPAERR
jgi:uncharacterized DUF497 family protein